MFGHGFDPVTEHGAGIGVDGAFDDAFVVVDEETRGNEDLRELLFHLIELDGAGDGVGGAASQLTLVVNVAGTLFGDRPWAARREGRRVARRKDNRVDRGYRGSSRSV